MKAKLQTGWRDTRVLFRSIPSVVTALFTISVVTMNILANKTIYQSEIIAVDGGILVSWLSFLCMDIVTKAFGPKAATKLSVFATGTNLLVCLIFKGIRFRCLLFCFRLPGLLFGSLFRRICQVPSGRLFCFGVAAKVVCLLFLRIFRLNLRSGGFCFQIRAVGSGLFLHILCCSLLRFRCHDRLHGRKRGHTDRGCQQNSGRPA